MRKINTAIASRFNRSFVLAQIYRNPLISRAELAQHTGLDRSAITHILNHLLKSGLVEEVKKGQAGSRGGRCPIQLRVRYAAASLIAMEIGLSQLTCVIANLEGREQERAEMRIQRGEPLLEILTRFLESLRRRHRKLFRQAALIGISCPGVVNSAAGRMVFNIYHNWRDVDVAHSLESRFAKPVFLENDANAAAIGELYQLAPERQVRSFIYLFLRESAPGGPSPLGVGGAILLNGRLWPGAHSCAGEVSETVNAAFSRIMSQLRERLERRAFGPIPNTLTELLRLSDAGHPDCQWAVGEIAGRIGQLLGEFAAFMDSQGVLVHVHPPEGAKPLLEKIREAFFRNYRLPGNGAIEFLLPQLGARAALEGIIRLGLERIFIHEAGQNSILFP